MYHFQVLDESDRARKALEFQLKMKTLEIEAALDTAEETRKKIVDLTTQTQKDLDDQIVNRLMHKHNVKPAEAEKVILHLFLTKLV